LVSLLSSPFPFSSFSPSLSFASSLFLFTVLFTFSAADGSLSFLLFLPHLPSSLDRLHLRHRPLPSRSNPNQLPPRRLFLPRTRRLDRSRRLGHPLPFRMCLRMWSTVHLKPRTSKRARRTRRSSPLRHCLRRGSEDRGDSSGGGEESSSGRRRRKSSSWVPAVRDSAVDGRKQAV